MAETSATEYAPVEPVGLTVRALDGAVAAVEDFVVMVLPLIPPLWNRDTN